jgi:hypothetical protein
LAVVNALWTITTGNRFSHDDPQAVQSVKSITKYFRPFKLNQTRFLFRSIVRIVSTNAANSPVEFLPFLTKFGRWKNVIKERLDHLGPVYAIIMVSESK